MKREITKKRLLVSAFALLAGVLLTFSQAFCEIWTSDCDFGMKDVFGSNEPVCVTGTLQRTPEDGLIQFAARVYVAPNRIWKNGFFLSDATTGGFNVVAGLPDFWDQYVWLPPLTVGYYDLILDQNQNGIYDEGIDDIVGMGTDYAFRVGDPVAGGMSPAAIAAIKSNANAQKDKWQSSSTFWNWASTNSTALSLSLSVMTGDVAGAVVNTISFGLGLLDQSGLTNINFCVDYNDAVINIGSKILAAASQNNFEHFKTLALDPPDFDYTTPVFLNMSSVNAGIAAKAAYLRVNASYPFQTLGASALEQAQVDLKNNIAMQSSLLEAIVKSLEKYQGAELAGDRVYMHMQAGAIKKYSDLMVQNLTATKAALLQYQTEINNAGFGDVVYKASDAAAIRAILGTTGLTVQQRQTLHDAGLTDTEIDAWITAVLALPAPTEDQSHNSVINDQVASVTAGISAYQTFSSQAQNVVDTLAPSLTQHPPLAVAGGPYAGNVATPIAFSASGSSDPDGNSMTYVWDFNLDGVFDDAAGITASRSWNSPFKGKIGLKVADSTGLSDIAYGDVTVTGVNSPPVIDSMNPAAAIQKVITGGSLNFSVTAHDPDGDPLSYTWYLNGVQQGTSPSWIYTPGNSGLGMRSVSLVVSDGKPSGGTTNELRNVLVVEDKDLDGVDSSIDCDDNNPSIGSGAQNYFYRDADSDGLGDIHVAVQACGAPVGYVANSLDCNDTDPLIGSTPVLYFRDADGDGFGNLLVTIQACSIPSGFVANSLDCNDGDPAVGNALLTFYLDADGDAYGNISTTVQACFAPSGYVESGLDCNDANPYINPGRRDVAHNGKDDDCSLTTPDNWSKSFVLSADDGGYIYYAKSNGDGTFSNYKTIYSLGGTSRGILIEDFNGDGNLDFIVGRNDGSYLLFINDGNDNFAAMGSVAQHPYNGCWAAGMSAGDFNNDGLTDFSANNGCSNITAVFLNDGLDGFTRSTYTLPSTGRSLNVAEIDGDGNLDFVVALNGNNDIWLYKGDGTGSFTPSKIGTASGSASDNYALAAADFDSDGKVDIILGGSSNDKQYFFKGNGNGTFQSPVEVPSLNSGTYNAIDAYDLNNDGNVDIVLADYSGRNLWFYPGQGDGTFGLRVQINTSLTSTNVLSIAAAPIGNPAGFPFADAEPKSQTINVGGTANLNGSYSTDPGGSIVSYLWKFGDSGSANSASATHVFTAEGLFSTTLTVTDSDGNKDIDTAQVKVLGNPPVANAGGLYTFGEQYASNGIYTVPLNGTGSADDFGIAIYAWAFNPFSDAFNGTTLDSVKWIASTGVTQNGKATIVGASGWENRYLFSQDTFVREDGLTFEFRVKPGTVDYQHAMFGVKNSGTNYNYTQMPHAFYFYQGMMHIYEDGNGRGQVGTYTRGIQYDLKLVLKSTGAFYYMRETGKPLYHLIYTSSYSNLSQLRFGGTVYSDSFEVDDVAAQVTIYGPSPNKRLLKGTFPVTLTVTDKGGQQATDSTTITTVTGISPTANPGGPYTQDETKAGANTWTIDFDGSGSSDDTGIESYLWDFGDGTAPGTGVKPSHVYTGVGVRTVTLTVTDRAGLRDTKTTTVTITGNAFPVAIPGGPYNVDETQVVNKHWSISVDASASTDDLGIWKYEWNFGDGTTAVATKTANHTYAAPGTYTVTLKVTDHANQSHSATTTAAVIATAAPTASPGGPYFTEPNYPVNFDGSGSSDNTGILSYSWNFGDGTAAGKGVQPSHAYASPGTYTVTLTVKDTALQTATATTTVSVAVGNAPVADAGGPYTSNVGVPVRLSGSGSTDDFGIASYEWIIGTVNSHLQDSFTGSVIDSAKWLFPAAGVTQNNAVTLTGFGGWGSLYLFSKNDYVLDGSAIFAGQVMQTQGGHLMFGFKNSSGNMSFEQMPYALYFDNGTLRIYEGGGNGTAVGSYSFNVLYDAKIELKSTGSGAIAGARYYFKPASSTTWNLLYDSSYLPLSSTLKVGATYHSGTFILDNLSLASGVQKLSGEKPVIVPLTSGTLPVQLTVTDGAGQSSTASSTLAVSSDPLVITAPWQFTGGVEVPHDTWSGEEVVLKAVVKSGRAPITYSWDFGDGTSSTPATVTDSYNLSAKHTYTAADGTPIIARITVTDADGKSSSDTFPIIVRPKSLNIEVNKAIDDGLWYVHTQQNRTNGSWVSTVSYSGYTAAPTASAIHSLEINGHLEVGDFSNDPYVEDVWRGMQYVMTTLTAGAISDQAYGDPDLNGNGIGLQVNSGSYVYEGGQVMMAIVASGTPNLKATSGGSGIIGRTYREIVEDMAEMYYWGQGDDEWGYGAGGWRYGWQGQGDNSASQWAALGFEAAEEQSWIKVPQWVRDRNIVWLAYSRSGDGNGYGYTGPGNDVATTPSGLAQVAFNKIPTTDSRWKQVDNFLAYYWNNWYNGTGNYYALYALAKAMRTAKPKEITILGEGTAYALDWYNDPTRGVARTIINQQDANGMFTGGGGSHWVEESFRTAWGVIILTKTLFVLPPVAVAGDSKVWGVDWPLTFDGSKSYHLDPFRKIVKYEWDFNGDGVYDFGSDQPTVSHTYSSTDYPVSSLPRTFKVALRVTDNNDPPKYDTSTANIVIAVPPHPPVAVPGGSYVGYVGIPLQLDGSASYDIDPTDIITAYGWELDGVYPYNFTDAAGDKPTYTWNTAGTYNIGLQVTDNGVLSPGNVKLSDTKWSTVTIKANHPPVANAGGPYTVDEGGTIQLDGSASADPDGNLLSYSWDLDNNGTFETTGDNPSFSRPDNGVFTVRLKVTDGALESIATTTVTVQNAAPAVNPLSPATINEGSTYHLATGSFVDPGADNWTATVDYGDGIGAQPLTLAGKTFSLSHLYPQNGSYTVTVTVTDKDTGTGTGTALVTVNNVAPAVNAGPDVTLIDTRSFLSSGSFTDPGTLDAWTATVNYGDGTGAQVLALNPDKTFALNHLYAMNGSFTVTVAVTDSDGATGSDAAVAHINNQAPVVNAGPDAAIVEGGTFSSGGAFTDPSSTSWTASVNYGDGTSSQPLTLNEDKTFSLGHVYAQDGAYTVTVNVSDSEGATGIDTAIITVGNVAPTVNAGPDATIVAGSSFNSSGSFVDPGADTWTATVDYGDGSGVHPLPLNANKTFNLSHTYAVQGTYTVSVTVQDNYSGSGTDTAVVTVNTATVPSCLNTISARAKTGMVQLNWAAAEHTPTTQYDIYRSSEGPNSRFSKIRSGYVNKYALFLDAGLTNGITYYYRVEKSLAPAASGYCSSKVVSGKPMGL